jgi:hypothetical protein
MIPVRGTVRFVGGLDLVGAPEATVLGCIAITVPSVWLGVHIAALILAAVR